MPEAKRVSIRYSVDLEEVPTRVKLMLSELGDACAGVSQSLRKISQMAEEDITECNEKMEKIITVFEKMIIRVQDCLDISNGYLALQEPPPEPEPEVVPPPPSTLPGKKVPTLIRRK